MSRHTPTAAAALPTPSFADVIPLEELAAAIRAAFSTLVSLLNDKKAPPRERRMAATALLRLAPRTPSVSDGPPPPPSPLCFGKGEARGEGSTSYNPLQTSAHHERTLTPQFPGAQAPEPSAAGPESSKVRIASISPVASISPGAVHKEQIKDDGSGVSSFSAPEAMPTPTSPPPEIPLFDLSPSRGRVCAYSRFHQ